MKTRFLLSIAIVAGAIALAIGCSENNNSGAASNQSSSAMTHKAGSQLWAENCGRCHNIRPPESFSDAQWQAVVQHMRLRADLTGEEQRSITEFLQASH